MNIDKAREAYEHDPQYRNLVDMLMNQVEALEMTPSEVREAGVFACILLAERRVYPLMVIDFAEVEERCIAAVGVTCTECHRAIGSGEDGLCRHCRVTKAADAIQEVKNL